MIQRYREYSPQIDKSCFIAENATIIGDVILKRDVSIWFGTVIRGDKDQIRIEQGSNIQDNCTLHTDPMHRLSIGERVTIGHNAIIHGAKIEEECLIGMGAILLNGAHIGKHCLIGAGAVVIENQTIPEGSVVVGSPARIIKKISEQQIKEILENAQHYMELGKEYKEYKERLQEVL